MAKRTLLDLIRTLDAERDHQRIVYLDTCFEFPFDTTRSLEFALFRTFAAPRISAILASTGEFQRRPQKRYDDTDLILSEIIEHGYDSERGRAAIRQMNRMHRRYDIANEDYLYVLSTFIYEPIRWNVRFGWREMIDVEKQALYVYWREVGRRMGIKAIPVDFARFERYNVAYEEANFRYAETNRWVAAATRDMFLGWFLPAALRRWGAPAIYAMMDDRLLEAFGFPRPPRALRGLIEAAVRSRGRLVRLLPQRRLARQRTALRHRTYPQGYRLERLGTLDEGQP